MGTRPVDRVGPTPVDRLGPIPSLGETGLCTAFAWPWAGRWMVQASRTSYISPVPLIAKQAAQPNDKALEELPHQLVLQLERMKRWLGPTEVFPEEWILQKTMLYLS